MRSTMSTDEECEDHFDVIRDPHEALAFAVAMARRAKQPAMPTRGMPGWVLWREQTRTRRLAPHLNPLHVKLASFSRTDGPLDA